MRALVVFLRLFPFVLAFVWDRRRFLIVGRPRRPDEARHRRRAERLTRTVAELGPTFIKLAQVFAARADILPEPYLGAIGTLTDQVPPLPDGVAEAVVRAELGDEVGRLFDRFDPGRSPRHRSARCTGPPTRAARWWSRSSGPAWTTWCAGTWMCPSGSSSCSTSCFPIITPVRSPRS